MRRYLPILALIALFVNAVAPFALYAAYAEKDGKILICTAEGYRYISAEEYEKQPKKPMDTSKQHCLFSVITAQKLQSATPTLAAEIIAPDSVVIAKLLLEADYAIPRLGQEHYSSRAPPIL
jgi:hypothetical protein